MTNVMVIMLHLTDIVQNIMGKGSDAEYFLLFPQCFTKGIVSVVGKAPAGMVWVERPQDEFGNFLGIRRKCC